MSCREKTVTLFLACALLLPAALGLRISRNGSVVFHGGKKTWREALPSVLEYRHSWKRRYHTETHLGEELPTSIRLILGVMTVAQEGEYRQIIRETWLRQAGVCCWSNAPKDNCSVYAAFVIGKNGSGTPYRNVSNEEIALAHSEEGMLVLDAAENMNYGKSFLWFATALKMFPWATHIGKMDMDTYPFVHKLLYRMNLSLPCKDQDSPYEFIGRPRHTCKRPDCVGNFSVSCPASRCVTQFHGEQDRVPLGQGWRWLQGQLYIMSLPLVAQITWDTRTFGNEDIVMSLAVEAAAKEKDFCVAIARPDAWYHKEFDREDAAYANDF